MSWAPEYSSSKPLFHIGERPISATLFLIGLHVAGLLFISFSFALHHSEWTQAWGFSSQQVFTEKSIWRWVTYAFMNVPNFGFLIDMFILYSFGKPLEELIGVKRFLAFYFALVMTGPILFTLIAPWYSIHLEGALAIHFGLVVAVALLYPDTEVFFFRIPLRMMMWILFTLYTLQFLANQNTPELFNFWLTTVAAWVAVRLFQGERFNWFADWQMERHAKKHQMKIVKESEKSVNEAMQLDSLLEKISKSGMKSLSTREKDFLEKARQDLLKKGK